MLKNPLKTPLMLFLLAVASTANPIRAVADDLPFLPVLINLPPERVFVPRSFDDNDNSQITVTGTFVSTCFRVAPPSIEVNDSARTIRIRARAFYYAQSTLCQRMLVPYVQPIDLGVLRALDYKIVFAREDATWLPLSRIQIAQSKNPGPDDYFYAHVTAVSVDPAQGSSTKTLTIEGTLLNTCMSEPEIRVFYRPSDVIEVLPIVTLTSMDGCKPAAIPYKKSVVLDHQWNGDTLVHVRALNGQAFNKVVTFAQE